MNWGFVFFLNSVLLGVGLAMDDFSLALVNGLNEPEMKRSRMCKIALIFSSIQIITPLIGWLCVHTIVERFSAFQKFIPWIALLLLAYIGGKMLYEGLNKEKNSDEEVPAATTWELALQGVAAAIDALSVGFTIAELQFVQAFAEAIIIGIVTVIITVAGLLVGKKFGTALSGRASVFGGLILIGIGLEIFIKGIFF